MVFLWLTINCLSPSEKSPSGPIKIQIGSFFDKTFFRLLESQFISQKIIFPFSGKLFKKLSKFWIFKILGTEILLDCSLASVTIFSALSIVEA